MSERIGSQENRVWHQGANVIRVAVRGYQKKHLPTYRYLVRPKASESDLTMTRTEMHRNL